MHFRKFEYFLLLCKSFSITLPVTNLNLVRTACILSTYLSPGVIPYISDDSSYSLNIPLFSKTPMSTNSNYT